MLVYIHCTLFDKANHTLMHIVYLIVTAIVTVTFGILLLCGVGGLSRRICLVWNCGIGAGSGWGWGGWGGLGGVVNVGLVFGGVI